jgi:hypothetical protein
LFEGQFGALAQLDHVGVRLDGRGIAQFQAVTYQQQLLDETVQRKLVRVLQLLGLATLHVLHLSAHAQQLILRLIGLGAGVLEQHVQLGRIAAGRFANTV